MYLKCKMSFLNLYQSFYWLLCWKLKLQYPFSGFDCQFIQGHWREFSIRNCTVWPILFFWMFSLLLKEPIFIFYLLSILMRTHTYVVLLVIYIPITAKRHTETGHGLKSHLTDWPGGLGKSTTPNVHLVCKDLFINKSMQQWNSEEFKFMNMIRFCLPFMIL